MEAGSFNEWNNKHRFTADVASTVQSLTPVAARFAEQNLHSENAAAILDASVSCAI